MDLRATVELARGIGPRRAGTLAREGIRTLGDLLLRLPLRYEDRRVVSRIAELVPDRAACVRARVESARLRRAGRVRLIECLVSDETGRLRAIWFNQPFLLHALTRGCRVALCGIPARDPRAPRHLTMSSPQHELIRAGDERGGLDYGRIVPIYERVADVSGTILRHVLARLAAALPDDLPESLPRDVRERLGVPALAAALRAVHVPDIRLDGAGLDALAAARSPAHLRLILEDLFVQQVALLLRRAQRPQRRAGGVTIDERVRAACRACLPFELTGAQRRVARELADDLRSSVPMRRLLQGDVGAGKTVLAMLAMVVVVENGGQAALMAPTELLAEQHYLTFQRMLGRGRYALELLTSSVPPKARAEAAARLASGQAQIVIGTHALLEPQVVFRRLALAVIDEQHRFGVLEREALAAKAEGLDVLVMTATPIPRTLALTAYGDLDVSLLDELPAGRRPVRTLVQAAPARHAIVELMRSEVARGHQGFVVFPAIEGSEQQREIRAAVAGLEEWRRALPGARVELLHGKMATAQREATMERFARGAIDVLVGTTVVEVGIDVANATVMLIEHAERFGLAQLHQLRGRVGRGPAPATCVLIAHGRVTPEARARLEAIRTTQDGFLIADRDLAIRGPGELLGTRQAGLPRWRVADLVRDQDLIPRARCEAERFVGERGAEQAARWLASTTGSDGSRLARVG